MRTQLILIALMLTVSGFTQIPVAQYEAEEGKLLNMEIGTETVTIYMGTYIDTVGTFTYINRTTYNTEAFAQYRVQVPRSGFYKIRMWAISNNIGKNSFFMKLKKGEFMTDRELLALRHGVDYTDYDIYDLALFHGIYGDDEVSQRGLGNEYYNEIDPWMFYLEANQVYTLIWIGRETFSKLDKFELIQFGDEPRIQVELGEPFFHENKITKDRLLLGIGFDVDGS